jgi:succinate dehydrogenase/fumarate reductase flavoprotein subunit
MVWPEKAVGTLATEAIRGEGGILLNSKGDRFMKNYYPERMELGPRDIVARANYNEITSGRRTERGRVWLDITHLPKEKFWIGFPQCMNNSKNLMELIYQKRKWKLDLLHIILWVE